MNTEYVTAREAARMLRVSESHIYRMIKSRELVPERHPLHHKHARLRIPRSQVEALLPKPEAMPRDASEVAE